MQLHTTSLKPWLDAVASKTSTPGGGNVAAVLGAQASALISMVCQFSSDDRIDEQLIAGLDRTRDQFLILADADSAAFDQLMLSYRATKADPLRAENLQQAITKAALIPMEIYELATKTGQLLLRIEATSNPNLRSDTAMAAWIINTTLASAEINVLINLKEITDKQAKADIEKRLKCAKELKPALLILIDSLVQKIAS